MSEQIQTKTCSYCKQKFPATSTYFYRNRLKRDGFRYECKQCFSRFHNNAEYRKKQAQYRKTVRGHLNLVWNAMLHRCNSPKFQRYKDYGGRGIQVKFAHFKDFFDYVVNELKADPRGLYIDRIDNDGHYEKGNIRFVTNAENCRNRKRVDNARR